MSHKEVETGDVSTWKDELLRKRKPMIKCKIYARTKCIVDSASLCLFLSCERPESKHDLRKQI